MAGTDISHVPFTVNRGDGAGRDLSRLQVNQHSYY